jgi:predicted acetyltransferase
MATPVRTLRPDELEAAGNVWAHAMLGPATPASLARFASLVDPGRTHGAFRDDGLLVGTARWFPTRLSTTGEPIPAAAVTSVAVLNTDRRRGHLTRLMRAQLAQVADEGLPAAVLIAAEAPIYGRFGYGATAMAADIEMDSRATSFRHPATGRTTLVGSSAFRPVIEAAHDARQRRTPGSITRESYTWDIIAGLDPWPDAPEEGHPRYAVWQDDTGEIAGAVAYRVQERWERYRPAGTAEVALLVGATPEAERELWRHIVELDWVSKVTAPWRAVDDPLPLWLDDRRTAATVVTSDVLWTRILDVPATVAALRAPGERTAVIEVLDDGGFATGTWALTIGPDGAEAAKTDGPADARLPIGTLGAAFLGGFAVEHLHATGWLDELRPGGVSRLNELFTTATRPWCTTDF